MSDDSVSRRFRLAAPLLIGSMALLFAGCATTSPRPPPDPATAAANAERSDETALALMSEMSKGDVAAARSRFSSRMKGAITKGQLEKVWKTTTQHLGEEVSSSIVHRSSPDGYDVRVVVMGFEKGGVQGTISTDPQSQEVVGFYLKPVPKPEVPGPAKADAPFRAEDVSVGHAPFVLDGILTLPKAGARFPGVVLVHGSGPHDKDGSIGPNKIFRDLAEGLAARGVAALRYDKRTHRYGTELGNDLFMDDEVVLDAIAAVELLKARSEIDPDRIFVVGHSLGALLAPEIAVRAGDVAGAALLAPPGRAPWDSVLMQLRFLEAPADDLAAVEATAALFRNGEFNDVNLLGVPGSYWKDWASRDGVAMAKELARPLLILRGSRDYQVTDDDLATWRQSFADRADVRIEEIPGANHLFLQGSGEPGPSEYFEPGHVDEVVAEKIAAFIEQAGSR